MYAFFFNLYTALFTGTWENQNYAVVSNLTKYAVNDLGTFLANIIGGNHSDNYVMQLGDNTLRYVVITFLSTITFISICLAVLGLVKKIFSIFFSGVR